MQIVQLTEYIVINAISLDIKKVDLIPPSGLYSIVTKYAYHSYPI